MSTELFWTLFFSNDFIANLLYPAVFPIAGQVWDSSLTLGFFG